MTILLNGLLGGLLVVVSPDPHDPRSDLGALVVWLVVLAAVASIALAFVVLGHAVGSFLLYSKRQHPVKG